MKWKKGSKEHQIEDLKVRIVSRNDFQTVICKIVGFSKDDSDFL
jgi:hypothetical protein